MKAAMDPAGGPARAEWGLGHYLERIVHGLGVGMEGVSYEADESATAYVALDEHVPGMPEREVALVWNAVHGWALGTETGHGGELGVVAYLGGGTVLAEPDVVVGFVKAVLAGHDVGQPHPPHLFCADLIRQLAAYAEPASV